MTLRLICPGKPAVEPTSGTPGWCSSWVPSDHRDALMEPSSFEIDELEFLDQDPRACRRAVSARMEQSAVQYSACRWWR